MNYRIKFQSLNYLWYVLLLLHSVPELWAQFNIPQAPAKIYPVNDYAQVLSLEQRGALNEKLITYGNSTSTEIVLISVQNLNGEDPNLVAANWGEKWKIGQEKQDNGILILLSVEDRKISIQNGRGIEPYLTDALSRRIIENEFIPLLKQGNYYGAFDKGTDAIFQVLKGTYKNTKPSKEGSEWGGLLFFVLLLLLFLLLFRGSNGGGGGKSSIASDLLTSILLSGMGRKDGGSFGRSDGGFGGFGGGGNFGGGGASGRW
ncbi:TPM domain-containing protein [Bacteroidetes bacterium endosymbiont of Geopemphigus sp.]|uniref:TPM domain-containing protein n=1 Tax=Bacteroidetes bacterium endosymbiont of Geopemphigus sp. TaxID=2047937 RepID=UPI000CD08D24|nr:TPM domain-containing protein [Bacteroidetes bacterium endosymbiont of Geopemphigus sp.]